MLFSTRQYFILIRFVLMCFVAFLPRQETALTKQSAWKGLKVHEPACKDQAEHGDRKSCGEYQQESYAFTLVSGGFPGAFFIKHNDQQADDVEEGSGNANQDQNDDVRRSYLRQDKVEKHTQHPKHRTGIPSLSFDTLHTYNSGSKNTQQHQQDQVPCHQPKRAERWTEHRKPPESLF